MADKRIDAHTNTTTVADVDEFIVDSGSNGTRNITYTNLKSQILGTTSIATIGNSVTEAIYNVHMDQAVPKYDSANRREYYEGGAAFDGNIDSVPTAGSNNAVSSGGTKTYVDNVVEAKADTYISPTRDTAQSFNVGTATSNRMFLLSTGYASCYQFGIVFINYNGTSINYTSISSTYLTVDAITYNNGIISITFSSTPYTNARLIRLC